MWRKLANILAPIPEDDLLLARAAKAKAHALISRFFGEAQHAQACVRHEIKEPCAQGDWELLPTFRVDLRGAVNRQAKRFVLNVEYATVSTVYHELMHLLGFEHTHQRSDRGDFIVLHEDRIVERFADQFIQSNHPITPNYFINSVMHYLPRMCAKEAGQPVFEVKPGAENNPKFRGNPAAPGLDLNMVNLDANDLADIATAYPCIQEHVIDIN